MSINNTLMSVLTEGAVDPSTKRLTIGLEGLDPLEGFDKLSQDEIAMSLAIHELTHFHTLTNPLGALLSAYGFLSWLLGSNLEHQIENQAPDEDIFASVDTCIQVSFVSD